LWKRPRPKLGCGAKEKERIFQEIQEKVIFIRFAKVDSYLQ
jgi:hypothetical protein